MKIEQVTFQKQKHVPLFYYVSNQFLILTLFHEGVQLYLLPDFLVIFVIKFSF